MKTLGTIQKTCEVFKILAKIGMILSYVLAGICLVGALCGIAARNGGSIIVASAGGNEVGISVEKLLEMTETDSIDQMIADMLSAVVIALTNGFLYLFAYGYLKQEVKDGTPFTTAGAERIKNLGIKTIVMPLVAVIISAVIYECFKIKNYNLDNGPFVVLGIALILFSLVLKHGAELRGEKDNKDDK